MTSLTRKEIRARFKAEREGKQVDPQHVFAGRIVQLLKAASQDSPGEWSEAYTEHVVNRFADRYVDLCRVAPLGMR